MHRGEIFTPTTSGLYRNEVKKWWSQNGLGCDKRRVDTMGVLAFTLLLLLLWTQWPWRRNAITMLIWSRHHKRVVDTKVEWQPVSIHLKKTKSTTTPVLLIREYAESVISCEINGWMVGRMKDEEDACWWMKFPCTYKLASTLEWECVIIN